MSVQDFENHLRENLDTHRSELDTEALWNNLAPVLAEDKKRRRGLVWWWTGAGLLALLLIGGWMYFTMPGATTTHSEENLTSDQLNNTQPSSTGSTSTNELQNATTEGSENEVLSSETLISTEAQSNTAPNRKGEPEQLPLTTQSPSLVKSTSEPKGYTAKKPGQPAATGLRVDAQPVSNTPTQQSTGIRTNNGITTVVETSTKNQPLIQTSEEALLSQKTEHQGTLTPTIESTNTEVTQFDILENVNLLATLSFLLPEKERTLPPLAPVTLPTVPHKTSSITALARADFGMGKPFRTFEAQVPDSFPIPDRSEKILEYLTADVLGGIRHRSGFYALAGLGYTRINEEFSLTATRTEYDSIPDGITEIYIDINGDSTFVYGPIEATRHISTRKRTYNSYTLWDIPVIAGFSFEQNRLSMAVEAGVFVNLKLRTEGDMLDAYNNVVKLEESGAFKRSIGLSYYGSLRFGYAIGDHFQVSLAPSIRIVPSITTDSYQLAQKYTLVGLNVGARWRF